MSFTGTASGEASTNVPEINAIGLSDTVKPLPWATGKGNFKSLTEINLDIHFIMDKDTTSIFSSLDHVTEDRIFRSLKQGESISKITVKQGTIFAKSHGEYVSEYDSSHKLEILSNVVGAENATLIQDRVTNIIISDRDIEAQIR